MKIIMKGFPAPVTGHYTHWQEGMQKHGDHFEMISMNTDPNTWIQSDCYLQQNMKKPKWYLPNRINKEGKHYDFISSSKKPFIVYDASPFRRFGQYKKYGWWSYKTHEGEWNTDNVDMERWNKFASANNVVFKDWHSPGNNILLMGQKSGDSALSDLYDKGLSLEDWLLSTILEIRANTDRPIVYRAHPRSVKHTNIFINQIIRQYRISNLHISPNTEKGANVGGAGLYTDLKNAYCVVTHSSNSGIEAAEHGIPVFALNAGSAVYPIAHHDLSKIENLNYNIDLKEWQRKIAYTFWNTEEVKNGSCWSHFKPVYFNM